MVKDKEVRGKLYNRPREEAERLSISLFKLNKLTEDNIIPVIKLKGVLLYDSVAVDDALKKYAEEQK
jgi:hypothetical protein